MKQSMLSLVVAAITYLGLSNLPYFPTWWVATFVLIIFLLGYYSVRSAVVTALFAIGISLAYHSLSLAILYFIFASIFIFVIIIFRQKGGEKIDFMCRYL